MLADWKPMVYRNTEMKLDALVNYFNEEKINLSPAFQRGHVWTIGTRKKLIKNIVQGKPIPAIFLYKEASGSRYSYNILDGKQRLESIILFVGNCRKDFTIANWKRYFFGEKPGKEVHFAVELPEGKKTFQEFHETLVRDFREYAIPTIEISLSDESSLDEIISLFVDINQQGVSVNRFDIVKAMGKNDPLLRGVFNLLALKQKRGQDVFYRVKRNEFTNVLKKMQIVEALSDGKSQVDRMWERLLEIVMFYRTKQHRKPVEILKSFISSEESRQSRLKPSEEKDLRRTFKFLEGAYKVGLSTTRLATDQTHFYVMITSLLDSDLIGQSGPSELSRKLISFAQLLDKGPTEKESRAVTTALKRYQELSARQTTDAARRDERQKKFTEIIGAL